MSKLLLKKISCPKCKIIFEVDLSKVSRDALKRYGIGSLAFNHGDHVVVVYIDSSGEIRGVETFPVAEAKGPLILTTLTIVPVPREKKEMPPLNELEREELAILVQCDGKRSIHEIADMLGMSIGKVKNIVEKLYAKGYLKSITMRVGE